MPQFDDIRPGVLLRIPQLPSHTHRIKPGFYRVTRVYQSGLSRTGKPEYDQSAALIRVSAKHFIPIAKKTHNYSLNFLMKHSELIDEHS